MTTVEIYSNIDALSDKIYELRADGVKDTNMIVVAKDRFKATFLRYTGVLFKKADGTMWDKIAAKFLDEDPEQRVVERLHLTGQDNAEYRAAVDNGKIILLVRSAEDEVEAIEEYQGSIETQDDAMQADGMQSVKPLKQKQPKKKCHNYMDAAKIIYEDGDKRVVALEGKQFTIVNMKHGMTEKDE